MSRIIVDGQATGDAIHAARNSTLDLTKLSTVGANEGDVPTIVGGVPTWQAPSGGGGAPIHSTLGVDDRTLTGDLTLTAADGWVQWIRPDQDSRNVTLPAASTSCPPFVIVNASSHDYTLNLLDANGAHVAEITQAQRALCWTNGTAWHVEVADGSFSTVDVGYHVLRFSGTMSTTATEQFLRSEGGTSTDSTAGLTISNGHPDGRTSHVATRALTIERVCFQTTGTWTATLNIYKNGVLSESVPVTAVAHAGLDSAIVTASTTLDAGDAVAVSSSSASTTTGVAVTLWCRPSSASFAFARSGDATVLTPSFGPRYFPKGGPLSSPSSFFSASQIYYNQFTAPVAGTLGNLAAHTSTGAAGVVLAIYKNGVEDQRVTLTGAVCVVATSPTAVAAGDELGLVYVPPTEEVFNASDTWTCPAGITQVRVQCWGAGGGGGAGGGSFTSDGGGGGGGGAYAEAIVSVTPGNNYTVSVGAGGVGVTATTDAGNGLGVGGTGGDTYFDSPSIVMAKGGTGGTYDGGGTAAGGQASSSVGDVTYNGGAGADSAVDGGGGGGGAAAGPGGAGGNGSGSSGGSSGGSGGGEGGYGGSPNGNGSSGNPPGGGGGGSGREAGRLGGNGASGRVILQYGSANPGYTVLSLEVVPDAAGVIVFEWVGNNNTAPEYLGFVANNTGGPYSLDGSEILAVPARLVAGSRFGGTALAIYKNNVLDQNISIAWGSADALVPTIYNVGDSVGVQGTNVSGGAHAALFFLPEGR